MLVDSTGNGTCFLFQAVYQLNNQTSSSVGDDTMYYNNLKVSTVYIFLNHKQIGKSLIAKENACPEKIPTSWHCTFSTLLCSLGIHNARPIALNSLCCSKIYWYNFEMKFKKMLLCLLLKIFIHNSTDTIPVAIS